MERRSRGFATATLSVFNHLYDNRRNDHAMLRNLTRAPGFLHHPDRMRIQAMCLDASRVRLDPVAP